MKMGTHFKKAIFEDHVQVGLVGWAQKARKGSKTTPAANPNKGTTIQLGKVVRSSDNAKEEIRPAGAAAAAAAAGAGENV